MWFVTRKKQEVAVTETWAVCKQEVAVTETWAVCKQEVAVTETWVVCKQEVAVTENCPSFVHSNNKFYSHCILYI